MIYRLFILISIPILLVCCKTNSNIKNKSKLTIYDNALKYVSKDSIFIKKIKNYYSDLSNCKKLNFLVSDYVEPITHEDFPITLYIMTKSIEKYDNINESEKIKVFDSIYSFSGFLMNFNNSIINYDNDDCNLRLNFAKRVNNLLPIKITIIDKQVDPNINYSPRKILYVLEYDGENRIIDREYLITSH
ncbi:hypothetical protein BWZ20_00990 [Winogradskyella sp. J14-2]|uniref:hypothetical protein n=1 Tax=Winogradskyella sp. J14-2 TaxID=1936080 RepID=UPI000972994C|nr:hypothetical protein [Winogradskyella sp. J14-2]APY06959.1 hypothetical protein BWZ20_00990 [Winogradskyella sp. J14-2]